MRKSSYLFRKTFGKHEKTRKKLRNKHCLSTIWENYFAFFKQNTYNKYLIVDIMKFYFICYKNDYENIANIFLSKIIK